MIQIFPAMDIMGGSCVRLEQGDFSRQKKYHGDPVEVAKQFRDSGLARLHLVDLDGARQGKILNIEILQRITSATNLRIDFGGGIQNTEDIEAALKAGASQIHCGSIAVKNRDLFLSWLDHYGPEIMILSADISDRKVKISGWQEATSIEIEELIESFRPYGLRYVSCTDIQRDGMSTGPSLELYQDLLSSFPEIKLIASGGVATLTDVDQLDAIGVYGIIIGRALYEGKITLSELTKYSC